MTRKAAAAPAATWCARWAVWLALLAVLGTGLDHRSARAQDPDLRRRATGSDTGMEPAGGAQGDSREVLVAPMPSGLPPSQERVVPAENQEVISFSGALALVAGRNPQIAFAGEQINEAFAQLRGAQVLWLPAIRAGVGYHQP
jgi:hypothetical protein